MPRIDPVQLLNCLQVLLTPAGGILSKNEVQRLASLMKKFSKKLVSKCVYVLILKNTETALLELFMAADGWALIHTWLEDGIYSMNWALVKEILELLLITPVNVDRLKSNTLPKFVKTLSKQEDLDGVYELANQLVQKWLKIVKDETQSETALQQRIPHVTTEVPPETTAEEDTVQMEETSPDDNTAENEESDSGVGPQTFYKLTLKDGKHLISKVGSNDSSYQVVENVEVVEMKDDEDIKEKEKKEEKKRPHDKSRHKSSSSSKSSSGSSSNRDKTKSSHRDKSRHSSSSNSKDKDKLKSRDKHKDDKSKDRHRSNGSVSKSSSKNSSNSSSPSSKDKEKEKRENKEKQTEKDKDTLTKIQPQNIHKLPKIPKKVSSDKDKSKDAKKDDAKRGTMSVEVRKTNEERPKTVKVYKSKMRSTGLEEEAKPAPPRPTKKPSTTPTVPPPPAIPTLKRPSPIRDITATPPEKKSKVDPPFERPGAIKLIPPKPKRKFSKLFILMDFFIYRCFTTYPSFPWLDVSFCTFEMQDSSCGLFL